MSRENVKLAYLSGIALILIVCVVVALGDSKKIGNNCEQIQCDTTQCDSTKCDTVMCDKPVGK
jgi:hypothetical protein